MNQKQLSKKHKLLYTFNFVIINNITIFTKKGVFNNE